MTDEIRKRDGAANGKTIRNMKDRTRLRKLLLDGAASKKTPAANGSYFKNLRNRIRLATTKE